MLGLNHLQLAKEANATVDRGLPMRDVVYGRMREILASDLGFSCIPFRWTQPSDCRDECVDCSARAMAV